MSIGTRRRRGLVLLALALASGGLAASEVGDRVREAEQRGGPPVPVVVAARDLEAGAELARDDLAVRRLPGRYAPPDSPAAVAQAVGLRTAGPVAAGSPITAGVVGGAGGGRPGPLRRGERALEVAVTGGADPLGAAGAGTRADLVVSTDGSDGPGRSFVALEDVELLGLRPVPGAGALDASAATGATALATVRVTARQAVYLTAADNFAGEIRLLARPPGDRRRIGRAAVAADGL